MDDVVIVQILHPLVTEGEIFRGSRGQTGNRRLTEVCVSHPDQIHQQRRLEHPVQTHVLVVEQILQAAPGAVFSHYSKYGGVAEQTQEQIEVFVPHVSELEGKKQQVSDSEFTLWNTRGKEFGESVDFKELTRLII